MFITEETYVVVPWIGPACSKNVLSVVVLSSNSGIIDRIATALTEEHAKGNFRWKLIVLRSMNLEDVFRQSDMTGRIAIDFVILGMDTSRLMCLEWTNEMIRQVHPDLRRRRVVLVNASGLAPNEMAVYQEDLLNIQSESQIDMLNANVYKSEESQFLARRLLKYMEVSLGVRTGLPNLNL